MRILILGGGISGLSAAWFLHQKYPDAKITLLEKQKRLGGWIETTRAPFFIEKGPRTFVASRSPSLLRLIREVGLEEEILFSHPAASKRYLWSNNALRSVGTVALRSSFSFLKELFVPPASLEDESIHAFAKRRFGEKIANTLFDPMTLGIYGGDSRQLSMKSCFPALVAWEKEKGSVLRGFFRRPNSPLKGLFTLKRGMGSLVEELAKKLPIEIVLDTPVEAIDLDGVCAGGCKWEADRIVSALPGPVLGKLTHLWPSFEAASLWVVSFVFPPSAFAKQGYGYLVPSSEKEAILGAVWDSSLFPQLSRAGEVRLSVMVRPLRGRAWAERVAREALFRHLHIEATPLHVEAHFASEAIPQFKVGYEASLRAFEKALQKRFPRLLCTGNYWKSPSVEECIRQSSQLVC